MSNPSPKIDGVEATFSHVDDIDWTEVQRQRNADGTVSVVREKWPIMRPDFLSAYVHYEPGMVVRRHGHRSNHIVFVLDGGAWIGGDWCSRGNPHPRTARRHVRADRRGTRRRDVLGAELRRVRRLGRSARVGTSARSRPVASRPLPDPPLDLGDWFRDPRGDIGRRAPARRKSRACQETVTTMDDFSWTEVKRQRNADGSDRRHPREVADRPTRLHDRVHRVRPGDDHPPPRPLRPSPRVGDRRRRLVRRSLVPGRHPHRAAVRRRVRPDHRGRARARASSSSPTATSAAGATNPRPTEQAIADQRCHAVARSAHRPRRVVRGQARLLGTGGATRHLLISRPR